MAIHLGPPVTRRLMRPTRGLGSAPLPRQRSPAVGLRPPIWPCSGWSLPRFTPTSTRRPMSASSLWHWSSPRGGRALPATLRWGARTFLTPKRVTPPDARPSDRLADLAMLPHATTRPANEVDYGAVVREIVWPPPVRVISSPATETISGPWNAAKKVFSNVPSAPSQAMRVDANGPGVSVAVAAS